MFLLIVDELQFYSASLTSMEENVTGSVFANGNITVTMAPEAKDEVTDYLMYKIGEFDNYDNISWNVRN